MLDQRRLTFVLLAMMAAVCFLAGLTLAGQLYDEGSPSYQQGSPPILQGPNEIRFGPGNNAHQNPCPGMPDSNAIWGHPWTEIHNRFGQTDALPANGPSVAGAAVLGDYVIDLSLMVADLIGD